MATSVRPEASFEEAIQIQKFWEANYERLLKEYPEQFVAVRPESGEVVASNRDMAMLVYELRDRGIDARADVAIQFISARSASLLL